MVDIFFGTNESAYQVNFNDWAQCLEGNIQLICLVLLLFTSAVFATIGIVRMAKKKRI